MSLHTGWLDTASRTPVYPAMNRPTTAPAIDHSLASRPAPSMPLRSRRSASRNDTVTKSPNATSAHAPTDIGDQYLKIGASWPGVVLTSMCQKRSG